jgi:hypothetical protein
VQQKLPNEPREEHPDVINYGATGFSPQDWGSYFVDIL